MNEPRHAGLQKTCWSHNDQQPLIKKAEHRSMMSGLCQYGIARGLSPLRYRPESVAGSVPALIFSPKVLPSELFFSADFFKPS